MSIDENNVTALVPQEQDYTKEIIDIEDIGDASLKSFENPERDFFTTMKVETKSDKIRLYNAIDNPTGALVDVKEPIVITDLVAHVVELENPETKKKNKAVREIVICADGRTFSAVSEGVANAFRKLFGIFGEPPWEGGITVLPQEVKTNSGRKTITFLLLDDSE
jgi:hypothetical protein